MPARPPPRAGGGGGCRVFVANLSYQTSWQVRGGVTCGGQRVLRTDVAAATGSAAAWLPLPCPPPAIIARNAAPFCSLPQDLKDHFKQAGRLVHADILMVRRRWLPWLPRLCPTGCHRRCRCCACMLLRPPSTATASEPIQPDPEP